MLDCWMKRKSEGVFSGLHWMLRRKKKDVSWGVKGGNKET